MYNTGKYILANYINSVGYDEWQFNIISKKKFGTMIEDGIFNYNEYD